METECEQNFVALRKSMENCLTLKMRITPRDVVLSRPSIVENKRDSPTVCEWCPQWQDDHHSSLAVSVLNIATTKLVRLKSPLTLSDRKEWMLTGNCPISMCTPANRVLKSFWNRCELRRRTATTKRYVPARVTAVRPTFPSLESLVATRLYHITIDQRFGFQS